MSHKILILFVALYALSCGTTKSGNKDLDKRNAKTYYSHGTNHLIAKKYTKALQHLLKAVHFDDEDPQIHNNLAMAYFFKGQSIKAISHLKTAIDLKDNNSEAKNNLASIYYKMGKLKKAQALYIEVSEDLVYASQYRTYYNLALISQRLNDTRSVKIYLENSIADNSSYCPAQFMLGKYYENRNNLKKAFTHLKKSTLNECYQEAEPNLAVSLLLVKIKKWKLANEKLKDFINRFPSHEKIVLAKKNLKYVQRKLNQMPSDNNKFKELKASFQQLDKEINWLDENKSAKSPNF